jgi:DNA helicase IV
MGLRLPTWQELSKDEQIPIVNLPLTKNYVVLGGPGTGKTIMALHRASKWKDSLEVAENSGSEQKILFLVYNRTLRQYLENALATLGIDESKAKTWHSWFYNFYRRETGESVPEIDRYKPDWNEVLSRFEKTPDKNYIDHLILDETQDFPEELLKLLSKVCKKASIFGDQNQAIISESTTTHFTNAFNAGGSVYYLTKNYRNTVEIAKVANIFYTGDPDDIPALSKKRGSKPVVYKCSSYEKCIELISNYADNNPSLTIGVLIPNKGRVNSNIKKYFQDIDNNTEVLVQQYLSNNKNNHFDFETDGVKILSYATAKGLEFDTVFLPEIDNPKIDDPNDLRIGNALYVASSRARTKLFYLYTNNDSTSFVIEKLNENKELLDWKQY